MPYIHRSVFYWPEEVKKRFDSARVKIGPINHDSSLLNVVFASDAAFLPYLRIALGSLLESYRGQKTLVIYLLTDSILSKRDRKKFESLKKLHQFEFNVIVVKSEIFENLRTTPGISSVTYFRLLMPSLLPDSVSCVLYLDADILVRHCISEIFSSFDDDALIFGVEDSISKHYINKLSQKPCAKHVNAGVLILNIRWLREIEYEEILSAFLKLRRYTLMLGDQEIINSTLGLVGRYLPVRWNVHGPMFDDGWAANKCGLANEIDRLELEAAIANPSIIHYTYYRKPWLNSDHPRAEDWHAAADRLRSVVGNLF